MKRVPSSRRLPDRACAECGAAFRPARDSARYCSRPCARKKNGGWNRSADGQTWWTNAKGYIEGRVTMQDGSVRRVKQHRWLMENYLGRKLGAREQVHHVNGDKQDNRIENLIVITDSEHSIHHNAYREYPHGLKYNLTDAERAARSERAKAQGLAGLGLTAIRKRQSQGR